MVRWDSGNEGRRTRAGVFYGSGVAGEVSPVTGGSVSSCGGTVRAMF